MASGGMDPWRLVLLGKTGVGKSATGNTILGENLFKSDVRATSVTSTCSEFTKEFNNRSVTVIDTPGLYDTSMSDEFIVKEIVKGVQLVDPGPHAFLLVIDVRRFTEEEKNTVRNFQQMFGDRVHKHMIVLFTRGDDLEFDNKPIETFLQEAGPDLQDLISVCGQRYHVFNNRERRDRTQVENLFQKIQMMLSENNHSYYSYEIFKMAKDKDKLEAEVKAQIEALKKAQLEAQAHLQAQLAAEQKAHLQIQLEAEKKAHLQTQSYAQNIANLVAEVKCQQQPRVEYICSIM